MDFILSSSSIFLLIALFAIGGIGSLFLSRFYDDQGKRAGTFGHGFALIGSFLGLAIAGSVLYFGQGIVFSLGSALSAISFDFRIDGLAAFFLGLISILAIATSLYGLSYQKHFFGKYSLGTLSFYYNTLILSLMLVTIANHGLFFLLVWEFMSLSSYFLITYENRKAENIKAGFLYFLMAHFGTIFIMLAFFLAYKVTGSFDFNVWRASTASFTPLMQGLIFACALLGFGTKAGVIPLHIWLPEAHPAAPSHVSALMSGVMIKTGIYMFVRFFFDFFPGAQIEWGLVFLVLGAISCVLGVLYALSEHDLKRLLAYHSVENIGIILLGFGAGLVFFSLGLETFALFALAASLFHTLNHAIFKALLFLGAGAVVSATGTRHMEEYGGLIRLMPYTAVFFLIGSLAISAFPPFNGFASEWLTFQALFVGISSTSFLVKSIFIFAITSLVFTGGLAAACFVKAFGTTFLARKRSEKVEKAHEVEWPMLTAMGGLALLTLVLGVFCTGVIASLVGVVASMGLIDPVNYRFPFTEFIVARDQFANVLPLSTVALLLALVFGITTALIIWVTRSRKVVTSITWDCGTPLTPRGEITASSFSRSLITIFRGLLRPTKQTSTEYHDEKMRYFIKSQEIKTEIGDPYRQALYRPLAATLLFVASAARRIQSGNVNMYLLYIFISLLALLWWAAR